MRRSVPWYRSALAGAPLLAFVIGGALVLAQFAQGTVEARDLKTKSKTIKQFTLEEDHARIEKKLRGETDEIRDLIIKRIPRPPEE